MKYLLPLLLCVLLISNIFGQRREYFRIFGVKIRAKDIVGIKKFNDIGIKYPSKVIKELTEDSSTYLWRLGSFMLDYKDYRYGTLDLFNLSYENHGGGYPLLDSIDFTYYREWGFQILENKNPTILNDTLYRAFKDSISSANILLARRRQILWSDQYKYFRERLLLTRFFTNTQIIALNKKIIRKLSASLNANAKTNISDLLRLSSSLIDTVTNKKVDSIQLGIFFNRAFNRSLTLNGNYITVVFQNEYLNKLSSIISQVSKTDAIATTNNEFNRNLLTYMTGQDNGKYASNSALFAFKFTGSADRTITSRDSIQSILSAFFHIGAKQAAAITATANFMFSRETTETLQNQFSKVWIIKLGSDEKFEKLKYKDVVLSTNY